MWKIKKVLVSVLTIGIIFSSIPTEAFASSQQLIDIEDTIDIIDESEEENEDIIIISDNEENMTGDEVNNIDIIDAYEQNDPEKCPISGTYSERDDFIDDSESCMYGYHPIMDGSIDTAPNKKLFTVQNSRGNDITALGDNMPVSYNSVEKGVVTSVKDQNPYNTCWAYSASSVIESSLISKGIFDNNLDISETQLFYFTNYNKDINDPLGNTDGDYFTSYYSSRSNVINCGGNNYNTIWLLANWSGACLEELATKEDIYNKLPASYRYEKDIAHLKNASFFEKDDISSVKRAIMQNGSVCAAMYYSDIFLKDSSYYCSSTINPNHAITIVGWDDEYDADNFESKPPHNGAWLIKNSYGDLRYEDGYFWMSYDDQALCQFLTFDCVKAEDDYDNNYFYDGGIYWDTDLETYKRKNGYSVANVFTAHDFEVLKAVSIGVRGANIDYSLQIYRNPVNPDDPTSGEQLLSSAKTGYFEYSGYHTVLLDEAIDLKAGDVFSVVFSLSSRTSSYVKVFEDSNRTVDRWGTWYTNNPEQTSFYKENNSDTWVDYAKEEVSRCARIHAFTNNVGVDWKIDRSDFRDNILDMDVNTTKAVSVNSSVGITSGMVSWNSSNTQVVSVDSCGVLSANEIGISTVTASFNGLSQSFRVRVRKNISLLSVNLLSEMYPYNRGGVVPDISVWDGNEELVEGIDYIVSCTKNKSEGTATARVVMQGLYYGEKELDYIIYYIYDISNVAFEYASSVPIVMGIDGEPIATNLEITPVSGIKGYIPECGEKSGYTVTYYNNNCIGTAYALISGNTMYNNTMVKSYKIRARKFSELNDIAVTFKEGENPDGIITYNGRKHSPDIEFSYEEHTSNGNYRVYLKKDIDYKVSYKNNTKAGTVTATFTGKGNYNGTIKRTYTIAKKNLSDNGIDSTSINTENDGIIRVSVKDIRYTGKKVKPSVKVTFTRLDGSIKTLKSGTDYKLSYSNNVSAATKNDINSPTVIITGKGNYCGTLMVPFNIVAGKVSAISLSSLKLQNKLRVEIDGDRQFYYSGYAQKPYNGMDSIVITDMSIDEAEGGYQLLRNADYSVSYSKNTSVGTAKVTIKGKGKYKGTIVENFEIMPIDMNNVVACLKSDDSILDDTIEYLYTGKYKKPSVNVYYLPNGDFDKKVLLKKSATVKLSYSNNKKVGTANLKVTKRGKGYSSESVSSRIFNFTIAKANVSQFKISNLKNKKYKGEAISQSLKIVCNSNTLKNGRDYRLEYENNTERGQATVTVIGIGNYEGERELSFMIL